MSGETERGDLDLDIIRVSGLVSRLELETKLHPKVRNHGEGPY